jgi:hypothetical protein
MVGEREREGKPTHQPLGKKGAFYRSPHEIWLLQPFRPAKAGQKSGLKQRGNRAPIRLFPAMGRLKPPLLKLAETPKWNGNNLSIRTPFSMILGSLESQQ